MSHSINIEDKIATHDPRTPRTIYFPVLMHDAVLDAASNLLVLSISRCMAKFSPEIL